MDYVEDDIALDPKHLNRVHEELEKLNIATDVINKLEMQLDAARTKFRSGIFHTFFKALRVLFCVYTGKCIC